MFACLFILLGVIASVLAQSNATLPTISAVGSKFFFANGTQYYIKGVAYQLTPDDPLVNTTQCNLDAAQMADLGANTIRVYHVDPTANHDGCMSAFASRGIYVFLDLDTSNTAFDQDNPYWNQTQYSAFSAVLDTFAGYTNVAGVFVANEALTRLNGSLAAPFIKAAIRDMKAYRTQKSYRPIPIGYAAADIPALRPMLQDYLACGTPTADAADFFAVNVYEWCGKSAFDTSGYSQLIANSSGVQIPLFISETGCHVPEPRYFDDQDSILGSDMANAWSGAIVYEWIQEENDYGLIAYGATVDPSAVPSALDGFPRAGAPTPVSPDYSNLKSHWATLHPTGVALSAYSGSAAKLTPIACPSSTPNGWIVNPTIALPSLGQTLDHAATSTGGITAASPSPTKKGGAGSLRPAAGLGLGLGLMGITFPLMQ